MIDTWLSQSCNTGIIVDGDGVILSVGQHIDEASGQAFAMGATSTTNCAIQIGRVNYTGNNTQAINITNAVTSSSIQISCGIIQGANASATANTPTFDVTSSSTTVTANGLVDTSTAVSTGLSVPNASQIASMVGSSFAQGITYTSQGPLTALAGATAGSVTWQMPAQGVDGVGYKKFVAYADAYENDTTTNQTITFPTAYTYTPAVTVNTTGLTVSATTTTLTITAPDATTTYSGVIEVVGI